MSDSPPVLSKRARDLAREVAADPARARDFLIRAEIVTESGKLTAPYRTATPTDTPLAGWRLVPIEPTEEMLGAVDRISLDMARRIHASSIPADDVWRAMLDAAPAATPTDTPEQPAALRDAVLLYQRACEGKWDDAPDLWARVLTLAEQRNG